ncbi:hypothetical protein [Streptomyces sp. TRM64462]|uniref:hypothetical protein n=1 Tax=Streptomyces sp. TRM64462 TaxID=2741726 RepID=UPI00158695B0|nr:hypothetical protein [Streptomyces sp. TRM64462]
MAGDTPSRKRRFRLPGKPEAHQGGTGPDPGAHEAPTEHSAPLPSPGARDDERGHPASLEATGNTGPGSIRAGRAGRAAHPLRVRRSSARAHGGTARTRGIEAVRRGVRKSGEGARAGLAHVADRIIENAPRVPVRDLATLRRQFPGLGPEELADKLVAGAAGATATVGAGVGAAAMLPVPPAMPAELAAEITGVAAIELKLIAELHEVYGLRPPGNLKQRAMAYLTSWTEERGIDVTKPATVNAALGGRVRRELRQQIMKRTIRSLPNLIPFMVGAAVGAVMNRRDTRKVAEHIRADLRRRQVPWDALAGLPPLEQPENPKELGF